MTEKKKEEKKEPVQLPICYDCGGSPLRCKKKDGPCKMEDL